MADSLGCPVFERQNEWCAYEDYCNDDEDEDDVVDDDDIEKETDFSYTEALYNESCINVNNLPFSVLIHIFHNLSLYDLLCRASLVCKQWRHVSRDTDLWRVIDFRDQHKVTDATLQHLVSLSNRVLELDTCNFNEITNDGFIHVLDICPHLRTLWVGSNIHVRTKGLEAIGRVCHRLQELHLDYCQDLEDSVLESIARGCPELIKLDIQLCKHVTDVDIVALANGCHKLQSLILGACEKVTDKCIPALVQNCPDLKVLDLASCRITDQGAKLLAKLTKLEKLDLSDVTSLSEVSIFPIVRGCHNLQTLDLTRVQNMDDVCVEHIARNLPHLKHLCIRRCPVTDKALCSLAQSNKQLKVIDLSWCDEITEHGVRVLSTGCSSLLSVGLTHCSTVDKDAVDDFRLLWPEIHYLINMEEYMTYRYGAEGYCYL